MRSGGRSGLRIATALMVLAGYLALYTVSEFGPMALVPPLLIFPLAPLAEWIDRKWKYYRWITAVISLACLLAVPLWWDEYGLLRAMVLLFIYIQAYEMFHTKTVKSYYHIYLMAFFLLVAACVENPDASIALVMALFLLSAVWAFFLLEIDRASSGGDLSLATPDILKLNERYATSPPPTPSRFNRGIAGTALFMSVVTLVMTAGMFLLTPRMEAGLFGRERMDDMMVTGLSEMVDLTQGGSLLTDSTPVMNVKFPDEPEGTYEGELYWRSHALNMYTGRTWEASDHSAWWPKSGAPQFVTESSPRSRVFRYPNRPTGRLVHQMVYMDEVSASLPVLDLAQRVEVQGAEIGWARSNDGTVQVLRSSRDVIEYEAWSEVDTPDPALLQTAPENYEEILGERLFGVYTSEDLLPETRNIVRDVIGNADTVYEKATALLTYLSGETFLYTTDIPSLPQEHAIDSFLQRERIGHCQLFASALALMLRSEGIPTRLVSGYRGGEYDSGDESYTIRADMAHIWVEVYFLNYGWVVFDPSPQSDDNDSLLGNLSREFSRNLLRGKMLWYQNVVGFNSGIRLDRLNELRANLFSNPFSESAPEEVGSGPQQRSISRGAYLALGGIILGIGLFVLIRRRQRTALVLGDYELTAEQRRASRVYSMLRRRMARLGIDTPNVTAAEFVDAVKEAGHDGGGDIARAVDAYVWTRFGMRPMSKDRFAELAALARRGPAKASERDRPQG